MNKPHHMSIPAKGLKIPTIAQVMKRMCEFHRYQDGKLWYGIWWSEPIDPPAHLTPDIWDCSEYSVFEFPVPVDDAGEGAFEPEMKAVNLMRWIRKHIDFLKEAKGSQDGA